MVTYGRTRSQCGQWWDWASTDCQLVTDLLSHMTPALSLNAPRLDVESLAHDCLERRVGIQGLLTIHLNSFVGWAIVWWQ